MLPFHRDEIKQAEDTRIARRRDDRFAGDDRGAVKFVQPFEPGGKIHGVANGRVVQPIGGAEVADERGAAVQAEAHLEMRQAFSFKTMESK